MIQVLFVCTGNICRSTMAEAYFRHIVAQAGLSDLITCDSAATTSSDIGAPINPNTQKVLRKHNIPFQMHYARQVSRDDIASFDYLLCMEDHHVYAVNSLIEQNSPKVKLFLDAAVKRNLVDTDQVDDPWYTGLYDKAYAVIAPGCEAFLAELRETYGV